MIERTAFDLRIAAHQTTTTAINASEWQHEQHRTSPLRARLAATLVALAARLDPGRPATARQAGATPAV